MARHLVNMDDLWENDSSNTAQRTNKSKKNVSVYSVLEQSQHSWNLTCFTASLFVSPSHGLCYTPHSEGHIGQLLYCISGRTALVPLSENSDDCLKQLTTLRMHPLGEIYADKRDWGPSCNKVNYTKTQWSFITGSYFRVDVSDVNICGVLVCRFSSWEYKESITNIKLLTTHHLNNFHFHSPIK